jgi:hypothetical protein
MKTKKILAVIVLIIMISVNVNAQTQPPNNGFENWVTVGTAENPSSWSSFNDFYMYGVPELSFKTTDASSGTYALRLVSDTATIPPPLGTNVLDTLAGYVFLGSPDMNNPGIPYTERPDFMQAYVKGTLAPGGAMYIIAGLRKWNTGTQSRDQVGQALYYMTTSTAAYTPISVPFVYSLPDNPDTLEIKIMAGDVGPGGIIMPGNEFFVDDLTFTFPVGMNEADYSSQSISVYPNPAKGIVTVNSPDQIKAVEIYNILGERIFVSKNLSEQKSMEIDLSGIEEGIYYAKIYHAEKTSTVKFVLQ